MPEVAMSQMRWSLLFAFLLVTNVVTLFILVSGDKQVGTPVGDEIESTESSRLAKIEASLAELSDLIQQRERSARVETPTERPTAEATNPDVIGRLDGVARSLADLRRAIDSLGVPDAGQTEVPDFAAEDGYVHANSYLEAGKFASAAEGFLEFLASHPGHPDRRNLMNLARGALQKAGLMDRAIDLQKEIIASYPEHREGDQNTLARMYFDARNYDGAIEAISGSIELTTHKDTQLWRMMYRAWYIQLRDGEAAGLQAYLEVDEVRRSYGIQSGNIAKKLADKISMLEERIRGG